ncbi:hypothetical protein DFH11DRAFT_1834177 [Phellopilus nigrolimitatus]|nr:hypothetical protein DFH11DRAFT_1834177 [Phellopilus nigrolimitatus]
MQPVAHFSVARNNGTMTVSEFTRLRGVSGHGHSRVTGLPSANSYPTAPANPHAAAAGPSSITITPFPVNHAVPRSTPTPESASPPTNPGLNVFSAEEQATIRSFLSAVGMSEAEPRALFDHARIMPRRRQQQQQQKQQQFGRIPLRWKTSERECDATDASAPRTHVLHTARKPSYIPVGGDGGETHAPAPSRAPLGSSTSIRTQKPRVLGDNTLGKTLGKASVEGGIKGDMHNAKDLDRY